MLELDKAQPNQFAACLNQDFEIATKPEAIVLQLCAVQSLGGGHRAGAGESFTLTFRGPAALRLAQGIYRMTNATLGEMELFLVQIAADRTSSTFEAVFN